MATASRSVPLHLEDVRHLLLALAAGDAVSDEVKNALAPVLYAYERAGDRPHDGEARWRLGSTWWSRGRRRWRGTIPDAVARP